jgi:two-component system LytT family response regulator
MNCVIIDDDALSRNSITHLVKQIPFLELTGEFSSASDALGSLTGKEIDLLLLDIEMPDLSGIELLRTLKNPPMTILITSKKEYALEAFECNVIDYIIKPVSFERFVKAVTRAKEIFDAYHKGSEQNREYLFVKMNGMLTKLSVSDILWIEALGDYIIINTAEKKYTIHSTMKMIESKLPSEKFIRVHRSFIVSLETINTIDDGTIVINKQLIPIGAVYRDNLSKRLNLL